jgi:predicted nucleic acid-binding protein
MPCGYEEATMLDSNLLIYSILADHPASPVCQEFIETGESLIASSITLIELFFVTTRIYGIEPALVLAKINALLASPLTIIAVDVDTVATALALCTEYKIDTNDAVQVQMCLDLDIPALATDDGKLIALCNRLKIETKNPITVELKQAMRIWEEANLPQKGLPRILHQIYEWIAAHDHALSDDFRNVTRNLTSMPQQ